MSESPYIFEANQENFAQLLQEKSQNVPVLVDFWAAWCQPCQMLMPVLANLAEEMQGAFILIKVNSDENQELAMQYGVRSLPTVKVFKNGEAVDEFMGVQPEPVIRSLINKHRTRPTEELRQQALVLQQNGYLEEATDVMTKVVETEPDYYDAVLDLVELLIAQGKTDNLSFTLDTIPEDQVDAERIAHLRSQLKLADMKAQAGDIDALEAKHADNPEDLQTMLELAKTYMAMDNAEAGLGLYLKIMQTDRKFGDDAGRLGLLEAFDVLGAANPLVKTYRNKMFSLLY
jgi:putative thioredoxin